MNKNPTLHFKRRHLQHEPGKRDNNTANMPVKFKKLKKNETQNQLPRKI